MLTVLGVFEHPPGKQVVLLLLKQLMIFREKHQKGRKFTDATGSYTLHRRGSSIWNLSFHKVLLLKNIPAERVNSRTWNPALVFAGKEAWCIGVLTAQGMSHIAIAVPGFLVMHASYVQFTYVASDPWTVLSRGWSLWLQGGGKMRTATSLCLHYSIACMDTRKSWLSSNRTTGPPFECLACAMNCFTYLKKMILRVLLGWTVC